MSERELEKLWNTYYNKVFGYFYRRLNIRQDVEDLTSVTLSSFLDAMQQKGDTIEKPEVYLWKIAHNQLSLWIRHKSKNPVMTPYSEEIDCIDESLEKHRSEAFKLRISSLLQCIQKYVSSTDYAIIEKTLIEDNTSSSVGDDLGKTAAAVRKRLSRALSTIRDKCSHIWLTYSS